MWFYMIDQSWMILLNTIRRKEENGHKANVRRKKDWQRGDDDDRGTGRKKGMNSYHFRWYKRRLYVQKLEKNNDASTAGVTQSHTINLSVQCFVYFDWATELRKEKFNKREFDKRHLEREEYKIVQHFLG